MHEYLGKPLATILNVVGVGVLVDASFLNYLPVTMATLGSAAAFVFYSIQIWDRAHRGPDSRH